ncbi:GAF and ANTAR domain-containing protein [Rhodococcoides fascians]|uniref:GAF and ANTAR domain-containing protein n=1 Tax=Rhodococcoides fascians TaxID=1828 RepID=UPI00068B4E53|nr:GAF and ANTAR domain-containing protein [Rhodococcus fascians]
MLDRPDSALERSAARAFDAEVSAAMSVPTRTVLAPKPPTARYYPDDTLDSIDTFRGLLRSHSTIESLLQGLCERVAAVVPGADMVGVILMHNNLNRPATVACSDDRVIAIDSDQYRANKGPGLKAARTSRIVCVRVDDACLRWPTFAANAADIGVRSYLSAPLKVESEHAGSLNLYGFDEDGFTDIDEVTVAMFVTAAETSIWNTRRTVDALTEVEGLRTAMLTRATIEQAKGILMAVRAISPEAAFTALAEQSQHENTRISVLAARIVATVTDGHREAR